MLHTYLGNRVEHEWMPLAMANGVDDVRQGYRLGSLYRWKMAPVSAALYAIGRLVGQFI